jgi:hypothetical protein
MTGLAILAMRPFDASSKAFEGLVKSVGTTNLEYRPSLISVSICFGHPDCVRHCVTKKGTARRDKFVRGTRKRGRRKPCSDGKVWQKRCIVYHIIDGNVIDVPL